MVAADTRTPSHRAARQECFDLARAIQSDAPIPEERVEAVIARARGEDWDDVVKLGLYLLVLHARVNGIRRSAAVQRLYDQASEDGDTIMMALALALRADARNTDDGRVTEEADHDMARAMVLLESTTGPSAEAVAAHAVCAIACEGRDLWELQLRHYDAAQARLDPDEDLRSQRSALLFNRAEVSLHHTIALRERGLHPEMADAAQVTRAALRRALSVGIPDLWRSELQGFSRILELLCSPIDARVSAGPGANRAVGDDTARTHCRALLEAIDTRTSDRMALFALTVGAELEAWELQTETAGLTLARDLIRRRWDERQAHLDSIESSLRSERLSAERFALTRQALNDDLTGIGNRRALARHVAETLARGVQEATVGLLDLDSFKTINDTYGHVAGDTVLVRVAALLRDSVRAGDLVVRLGGDEFLIVMTTPDEAPARTRCEEIVRSISELDWEDVCPGHRVSASVGIVRAPLTDLGSTYSAADAALYRAKRVCLAP